MGIAEGISKETSSGFSKIITENFLRKLSKNVHKNYRNHLRKNCLGVFEETTERLHQERIPNGIDKDIQKEVTEEIL